MYSTKGIEAVATVTEVRTKTNELVKRAQSLESGILVQRNNEPLAVLVSHEFYTRLIEAYEAAQS